MRFLGGLLALSSLLAPAVPAADPSSHRPFVQQAVDNYFRSLEAIRTMTYRRRVERKEYDSKGQLQARSCSTHASEYIDGVRWNYIVERDDKPLPDLPQVMARVRSDIAEWKRRSPEKRRKAEEEIRKRSRRETDYLREFAEALDFVPLGVETRGGRAVAVFSFSPRPGYKPKALEGRVYEGVRGKLWIDQGETQILRMEAEIFKEVSLGGILARVEPGTRFELDQARLEPGLWVPRRHAVRFDLKVLMLKQIHNDLESQFIDYRRYTGPVFSGE